MALITQRGVESAVRGLARFGAAVPKTLRDILRGRLRQAATETRPSIPARTGGVRRLFSFRVTTTRDGDIRGRIGFIGRPRNQSEAVAPHVFEKGANITPKKGSYLWIPIAGNRDAAGRAQVKPRELGSMVILRSRGGNLIAFRHLASEVGSSLEPMFLLRQYVRIEPRPVIAPMEKRLIPAIEKDVKEGMQKLTAEVK